MISTNLTPMKEQIPNVIRLPYAQGPALFFQAPSWRRLLKLMARLSTTRMEPTLEALAVAQHELKLRTVIQFVKVSPFLHVRELLLTGPTRFTTLRLNGEHCSTSLLTCLSHRLCKAHTDTRMVTLVYSHFHSHFFRSRHSYVTVQRHRW